MKKGFTLIELLGILVILALILLVTFPPILNQINKSRSNLSDSMKSVIFSAADTYIEENKNTYSKKDGNVYCITLKDLVNANHLREPLIDSNGKNIELTNKIEVYVENAQYKYKMNNGCTANN